MRGSFSLKLQCVKCVLAARTLGNFVARDRKYQTRLMFGLDVTNDKNTANVTRTPGNFADQTCHE